MMLRLPPRQCAPWLAVVLPPVAAFAVMRAYPTLDLTADSAQGHFYIVSIVSVVSGGLGLAAALASARVRSTRVLLLALSYLSMSVIFAVHGLSTPGFIVGAEYETVTALSSRLAILVASILLAASTVRWRFEGMLNRPAVMLSLTLVFLVALLGYAFTALAWPQAVPPSFVANAALKHGSFAAVLGLATFAGLRYLDGYRRSGLPLYGAVTLGSVLIVEAQLGMEYGQKFHASWWMYHLMLLMAFSAIFWGIVLEYARGRSPVRAMADLTLDDPMMQIRAGYTNSIVSLSKALEARDGYTLGHGERVAALSLMIGEEMRLPAERLRGMFQGALLHDVGKIGVPDHILHKPERLTDEEFKVIQSHPPRGESMLRAAFDGQVELAVIRHHHERFDGLGYPDGRAGDEIPLEARIVAVADVYDALRSTRSYRPAWTKPRAQEHIRQNTHTHFDAVCVRAFFAVVEKWEMQFANDKLPYEQFRHVA